MKLRTHLFLLVAGTAVPLLVLAAVLAYILLDQQKQTFQTGARDRNRAFMTAVDAEIRGHFTTLEALATSASLERGNLSAFYDEATRVLASQPDWAQIILSDTDGRQVLNTRVPLGAPLGATVENVSWQRVVTRGDPAVGLITKGPLGNWGVPARVPVRVGGVVRYVLTAPLRPEAFERLIAEQRFPSTWAAGLLDSAGRFVARFPGRPAGQVASPDFQAAVARSREGWYRGRTLEGVDTYTAHRTSETSGWTVGVAIPSAEIFAPAYRTAIAMLVASTLTAALALLFAWRMGRRVALPITALAARAHALGTRAAAPDLASAPIDEVRAVDHALAAAGEAIAERESLRDREQVALKAADKAKDEFLAMLGHELRNPLSAITASAHVLRFAGAGDDKAARAHAVIERQTRLMTRLIDDLLDVSRLAVGKVGLRRERFDLAELARQTVQAWQHAAPRAPHRIDLQIDSAWVEADRSRLEQVIANLLDNADKFSPRDTTIELGVARVDDAAVLTVTDRGDGIEPAMLERIFEAFVQAPQGLSRDHGGLGLGLTLVKRLVEMHGGAVSVFSAGPGTGARFTVRLPAVPARMPMPATAPPKHAGGAARRVLLVEDNEDGRTMMEELLRLEGHDVRAAPSGAAALAQAAQWPPDVVLVDIGLPDMDGYEVARRVRAARVGARLVALSGYGQPEDERRAREAGFDVHLTKPVSAEVLRNVIAGLVPAATIASR